MPKGQVAIDIDRPADDAWKVIADYGGLATWMPGVDGCTLEGDVRIVKMLGMEIEETRLRSDDVSRNLAYSITGGIPGLESHASSITVHEAGAGCRVTWDVEAEPAAMLDVMTGAYDGALKVLKSQLES